MDPSSMRAAALRSAARAVLVLSVLAAVAALLGAQPAGPPGGARPAAHYLIRGARLLRYEARVRDFVTVFDAATQFGEGREITGVQTSADDTVHAAVLRDAASHLALACITYREDTRAFSSFPAGP